MAGSMGLDGLDELGFRPDTLTQVLLDLHVVRLFHHLGGALRPLCPHEACDPAGRCGG